jgi:hypothetical protein
MTVPSPITLPDSPFETLSIVSDGIVGTAPTIFTASTTLDLAALTATGLLNPFGDRFKAGDQLFINYSDTSVQPVGGGNANQAAIFGWFFVSVSGSDVSLVANALSNATAQFASVAITAAQFKAMYTTPVQLVAAPGSGKLIVVQRMILDLTYVSATYAVGGSVAAQYDNTTHGGGVLATNTEQNSDFYATASTAFTFNPSSGDSSQLLRSTTANKGLFLSNDTAAFTTGDGTFVANVWYNVISV